MYYRYCPKCNNKVEHKNEKSLYISKYNNSMCKRCHSDKKLKNKCSILLDESLESYYWLGFIFADGHVATDNYNVCITLHEKDKCHLQKLVKYCKITSKINFYKKVNQVSINFAHKPTIGKLMKKYNIHSNKTENPPDIKSITGDKLKAFNVGFIDGDGCISKYNGNSYRITIKGHINWAMNFKHMFNKESIRISKEGYCDFGLYKRKTLLMYREFVKQNKLPVLKRKWEKLNLAKPIQQKHKLKI